MNWRVLFLTMSAMVLTSGCVSRHYQGDSLAGCLATCERLNIAPTHYILTVNVSRQSAYLYEQTQLLKSYACSTSRFGIGEVLDSNCTPRGLHRIAEKVGDGELAGTIFKDREVIGHVSDLGVPAGTICTRIMWLEGLEPGFNQGGKVDTHERMIYIHGTGDQNSIGRPASLGCIHFADADLISLFDLLPSGTLVWIAER